MSQLITLEGDQTEIGNFQVLEVYGDFLNQEIQGNFVEGNFYAEKALVAPKDSLNGENSYWMSLSGDGSEMGWAAMAKAFSKFGKGFGKGLKIKVPKIKAPKMPKMPKIKIKAPKMPKMPKIKMPKMPKIKMPKMPKFKMPEMPEDQTEEDQTEEDQTEEDQTEENQTEENQTDEDQTDEDQTDEDQTDEETQTEENQTDEETQTEEDQTDMNDETQLNGNIYNRVNNEMGFLQMLMPLAQTGLDIAQKNQQAKSARKAKNSRNNMNFVKSLVSKPKTKVKQIPKQQAVKKPVALKVSSSGKMSLSPQVKQTQIPKTRDFFEKEKSFYETPQGMAILGGGAIAIFYFMNKKGKRR